MAVAIVRKSRRHSATVRVKGSQEAGSEDSAMKITTLAMALPIGAPQAGSADVSKEELRRLHAARISDDVNLEFVRSSGPVVSLASDDVVELNQTGANDALLAAVLAASSPAASPSPVFAPPGLPSESHLAPSGPAYTPIPSTGPAEVDDGFSYPGIIGFGDYYSSSFGLGIGTCGGYSGNRFIRPAPGGGVIRGARG